MFCRNLPGVGQRHCLRQLPSRHLFISQWFVCMCGLRRRLVHKRDEIRWLHRMRHRQLRRRSRYEQLHSLPFRHFQWSDWSIGVLIVRRWNVSKRHWYHRVSLMLHWYCAIKRWSELMRCLPTRFCLCFWRLGILYCMWPWHLLRRQRHHPMYSMWTWYL